MIRQLYENIKQIIIFEGVDGSGKTTRARHLTEQLSKKGFNTKLITFPSPNIKQLLKTYPAAPLPKKKKILNLLELDFQTKITELFKKKEQNLDILIFDRYVISTVVYQQCKEITPDYLRERFYSKFLPNLENIEIHIYLKRYRKNDEIWDELFLSEITERYKIELEFLSSQGYKIMNDFSI